MEASRDVVAHRSRRLLDVAVLLLALIVASPSIALGATQRPAQASPGYIGSPILEAVNDPDGDGVTDAIVLAVPFVINDTGTWYFGGGVYVGTEWAIGNSTDAYYLAPGTYDIDLSFPTWRIRAFQTDGPYTVALYMYQQESGFSATANHTTAAYAWWSFEFFIEIVPPIAERPIDADADGRYNYLEVSGRLNVSFPEMAYIEGRLYSETGTFPFAYLSNVSRHAAGSESFAYRFSGDAIRSSNVDGIFRIELEIRDFGNYSPNQMATLLTRTYAASQFFHQPITITGSLSDHPIDFDGNGLYDVLRIVVPVDVRLTGVYRVFTSLEYPPMSVYISGMAVVTLNAGATQAYVDIDGFKILKTYNSFSYYVQVYIVEDVSPYQVWTSGTTALLPWNEFDNPYGNIDSFTVTPVDEDRNGEFESVRLEATIRVKQFASFGGIFAIVADPSDQYWDEYFSVRGTPGFVSVGITFPGWRLRTMGWNGTYGFLIMLGAEGYGIQNRYLERNFTYNQFEPALRLVGPLSLEPLDSDGDGLWNQLLVHVPLRVEVPGSYLLVVRGRDQGGAVTGSGRSRYLDPGDMELAIGLSGIALSGLTGSILNVTFFASLAAELGSSVTVMDVTEAHPFDPIRFQTAPRKTVAFQIAAPEPITSPRLELRNYSNAVSIGLSADANGEVTATLPDLQYDLLTITYSRNSRSRFYGQVSSLPLPLPGTVSLYLNRPEPFERDRTVILTDWSSGLAATSFTFGPYGYFRWFADGNIDPDGYVSAEEVLNLARLDSGYFDSAPALWIDDVQVTAVPTGLPASFGEGAVLAADGPGFVQAYSLSTASGTGSIHTIRVNVSRESDQLLSAVTVQIPPAWKVASFDAPPGVAVTQLGPREVSINVTEPRYAPYSVNLTAIPDSSAPQAEIAGRVEDAQDRPIAAATVRLYQGPVEIGIRTTPSDGSFAFSNLAGGTYRLNVTAAGYLSIETTEAVSEGQHLFAIVVLSLPAAGSIVGRVVDSDGQPIAGATVSLLQGSASVSDTSSGASGDFAFENLSPDSYTLRVSAPGFVSATVPANVAANAPTDAGEIVLQREAAGPPPGPEGFLVPAAVGIAIGVAAVLALVMFLRRRSRGV